MNAAFFKGNREAIAHNLKGALIVVTGYSRMQQSNDAAFPFEQEANFWYLSGIEEPDWLLLIDGNSGIAALIAPDVSDAHALFDGNLNFERAKKISAVNKVMNHDEGMTYLRNLKKKHSIVYTVTDPLHADYFNFTLNPAPARLRRLLERTFDSVLDCAKDLAKMRAIKQPEEVKAIEKAVRLTADSFKSVKSGIANYNYEYEIEADFSYLFRTQGARGHAYTPIVASGKNACTLHYTQNSVKMKPRDLVLIDIGARVGGYSADITRTYSQKEPSKRQLAVHTAVRDAHSEIISLLEPGLGIEEYIKSVDTIMQKSLKSLGLIEIGDEEKYRKYFPHAVSHGLGIDVHDSLGSPRIFASGMVLTVEPGIYIPEENIGVRIEDDILITDKGNKNLSGALSTEL